MGTETLRLSSNGLNFAALASGPADGPLILFLHGFPELALSWQPELEALGAAAYRAIAPDLRGYGGTDVQGPYDGRTLATDIKGLIAALGRSRAVLVGHDWGGNVAWQTAILFPEVVEKLIVLNCPHPGVMQRALRGNPRQLLRSWYFLFFQLPRLPEWVLTRRGARTIAAALRSGSSVSDAWTKERLQPYRDNFLRPGRAAAALGYYRAMSQGAGRLLRTALAQPLAMPTLILWGAQDRFLGLDLIALETLAPWFAPGNLPNVEVLDGVGHFLPVEAPAQVSAALLAWLSKKV